MKAVCSILDYSGVLNEAWQVTVPADTLQPCVHATCDAVASSAVAHPTLPHCTTVCTSVWQHMLLSYNTC
jgi:hypothetical protein